ncbi:MAG: nitroreductase family protein [Candidatus Omnitrophota bacterium]|nr:nitroreductase family protein [Candidatus Omnitrophota bacterium]
MLEDLIRKSRSYRRFDESFGIEEGILRELVGLARVSPSARNRQALKFILSCSPEKNSLIFSSLGWALDLKDWKGPEKGERPAAYIIILGDERIAREFGCDHGIAAQSILLGAVEKGLGGCIMGSVDRGALRKDLNIPERYGILLVIALGKPAEKVVLEDAGTGGSIKYYRDEKDVHHVPKRPIDELIIDTRH